MKLRNKKTGEICELKVAVNGDLAITKDDEIIAIYNSLAELNEEWEDYEEFEGYFVDAVRNVIENSYADRKMRKKFCKQLKQIGNYFETKEEAEKAVEKLKAWKRLKDKGFRFDKWINVSGDGCSRPIWFYFRKDTKLEDVKTDLDLLFGGEE